MILYESLGTYYINYDLNKDKVLDNPKQVKLGSLWRLADSEEWESLALTRDNLVLLRIYKRKPHNDTGEYLICSELDLKQHFREVKSNGRESSL